MEKAWIEWVEHALPKAERNKGENMALVQQGYDPDAESLIEISGNELGAKWAKYGPRKKAARNAPKKAPSDTKNTGS